MRKRADVFFLNMTDLIHCVLVPQYFDQLNDGGEQENATDYPVEVLFAVGNTAHEPLAAKNKHAVPHKGSNANANDVAVVLCFYRFQDFLGKQYSAPAKPKGNLHGIDGTHEHTQQKPVHVVVEHYVFSAFVVLQRRPETAGSQRQYDGQGKPFHQFHEALLFAHPIDAHERKANVDHFHQQGAKGKVHGLADGFLNTNLHGSYVEGTQWQGTEKADEKAPEKYA